MGRGAMSAKVILGVLALVLFAFVSTPQAIAGSSGSNPPATASVVKGTTASIASFPWLAHINYEGPVDDFECSGTVVAPRVIMTAGHCAVSEAGHVLDPSNYYVITGLADLKQVAASDVSYVSQVLVDPDFEPATVSHDAALLILSEPVSAPAIPLAEAGDEGLLAGGTGILIAGWGLTSGTSTVTPTVLREGETVIQDAAYCNQKAKKVTPFYESSSQLCAIAAPKFEVGACHGDSGGPGIAFDPGGAPVQVGIISLGAPDCRTNIPGVETRVDKVAPWVHAWIAAVEAGGPSPAVVQPPLLTLPKLTLDEAAYLGYVGLTGDFGKRFTKGRFKEIGCSRIEREKVKCSVFWYLAGSVYSGSFTVYFALPREGALWNLRYRIRKVGAGCWLRTEDARRCPGNLFYR